jgi:hypothetical protein
MKRLKWIIENFTNSTDYVELAEAVIASGRELQLLSRKNNFEIDYSRYSDGDLVLFQGSIQTSKNAAQNLPNCRPILFNSEDKLKCSSYCGAFAEFLFNNKYEIVTVGFLKKEKFEFYRRFGKDALIFIRPDDGDKKFSGQLLDLQDFDKFWDNNIVCNAKDDDSVLISTPKTITGEWRFIVKKDGIISCSTYFYQGQKTLIPNAPTGATSLVNDILSVGYHPDKVYAIDICQDADGNFWLLEFNSFSSSGLYACNKRKIVDDVNSLVESEYA